MRCWIYERNNCGLLGLFQMQAIHVFLQDRRTKACPIPRCQFALFHSQQLYSVFLADNLLLYCILQLISALSAYDCLELLQFFEKANQWFMISINFKVQAIHKTMHFFTSPQDCKQLSFNSCPVSL